MDFKRLLENCTASQSTITKTGVFYSINGKVVLEYMKSTKNVWVDDDIVPFIIDKNKAEKDIIEFFGKVSSVYFGMGLNSTINERNEKIEQALKKLGFNLVD